MSLLAYTPFVDPINAHDWWYLFLFPVALFIAIAYKAVRVESMKDYAKEVVVMAVQIIVGMVLLGIATFLFVEKLLPLIAT